MTYSPQWIDGLRDASQSNATVYVIDPEGLTGNRPDDALAFSDVTGGQVFTTNEREKAVDRVWDEAGHYYLLGYEAPAGEKRKTHTIDVRARRDGVRLRARQQR